MRTFRSEQSVEHHNMFKRSTQYTSQLQFAVTGFLVWYKGQVLG